MTTQYNFIKHLPKIKAAGASFAFSGLDGRIEMEHQLVGTLLDEDFGLGIEVLFPEKMLLWCDTRYNHPFRISHRMILSDAVCYILKTPDNKEHLIEFAMVNDRTIVGRTTASFPVRCCRDHATPTVEQEGEIILESPKANGVLLYEQHGEKVNFAFSMSCKDAEHAQQQAQKALGLDLAEIIEQKKRFYLSIPEPKTQDPAARETYYSAASVIKSIVYSPIKETNRCHWTTPSRAYFLNRMWLWDSAFHILGLRHLSTELAQQSIEAMFGYQQADGFIPHTMSPKEQSSIIQPPLIGWASLKVYETGGDKDFLRRISAPLEKFLRWTIRHRSKMDGRALGWFIRPGYPFPFCKAGETGMDNTPRFDKAHDAAAVDLTSYVINEIERLTKIAEITGQKVADDLLAKRQTYINTLQQGLWDDQEKFFYDRNIEDNSFITVKTVSSFIPLFCGAATQQQAGHMVKWLKDPEHFWTTFPVPSTAISEAAFTKDYWRGLTWVNYNYMIIEGLLRYGYKAEAEELRHRTITGIVNCYKLTGCLWENYDPQATVTPDHVLNRAKITGIGTHHATEPTARSFGWTSAVFMDLLLNESFHPSVETDDIKTETANYDDTIRIV